MSRLAEGDLRALRTYLASAFGLRAEAYRDSFLERRVLPRLEAAGCPSLAAYLDFLRDHPAEARTLLHKVLVPTTEFFRNPEVFRRLAALLAERREALHWKVLRLLSAPCSTGEEAYSLALLLERAAWPGGILAVDRSLSALRTLRAARYPARLLKPLDREGLSRYFTVEEGQGLAAPVLRKRVLPVCADLSQGVPGRGFHVALVRNLFIYLTEEAQERLLREVHRAILPGGLLVLGRVEGLPRGASGLFQTVDREGKIFERKAGSRP
ncbi:MAG: CheR family methyltransferase [Acidobacteriota bacterium]